MSRMVVLRLLVLAALLAGWTRAWAQERSADEIPAALREVMILLDEVEFAESEHEVEAARDMLSEALELLRAIEPCDEPGFHLACDDAAARARALGLPEARRAAEEMIVRRYERLLPPHHGTRLAAEDRLARTLRAIGEYEAERSRLVASLKNCAALPLDHPMRLELATLLGRNHLRMGDAAGARALQEEILELHLAKLPRDEVQIARAREELGRTLRTLGDIELARAQLELAVSAFEEAGLQADLDGALQELAFALDDAGEHEAARRKMEQLLELRVRRLPAGSAPLFQVRGNLARNRYQRGDRAGGIEALHDLLEDALQLYADDHNFVVWARLTLFSLLHETGDPVAACEMLEKAFAVKERSLPPNDPERFKLQRNLATVLRNTGRLREALAHQAALVQAYGENPERDAGTLASERRTLGQLYLDLDLWDDAVAAYSAARIPWQESTDSEVISNLDAARGLARALERRGDLTDAQAQLEEALVHGTERLGAQHPAVLWARRRVAALKLEAGAVAEARAELREVLEACSLDPPEEPELALRARLSLAESERLLGRPNAAIRIADSLLADARSILEPDSADLLGIQQEVARHRVNQDPDTAVELMRDVVRGLARTLPPEHPELLQARGYLAICCRVTGDAEGAREALEATVEAYARLYPDGHPARLNAELNLADALIELGELDAAEDYIQRALSTSARFGKRERVRARIRYAGLLEEREDWTRLREVRAELFALQPSLLHRMQLGSATALAGDHDTARHLYAETLSDLQREFSPEFLYTAQTRDLLIRELLYDGATAEAEAAVERQLDCVGRRLLEAMPLSERDSQLALAGEAGRLANLLLCSQETGTPTDAQLFELFETRRLVATRALSAETEDSESAKLRAQLARATQRLNDLVASGTGPGDIEGWRTQVGLQTLERGRIQRLLFGALAESGRLVGRFESSRLDAALPPGAAAVGFHVVRSLELHAEERHVHRRPERLIAFVSRSGEVRRVELGEVAALGGLIEEWRVALGQPVQRGLTITKVESAPSELAAGRALRRRLLDPILEAAGDANTFVVCLDDLLHLLPLDALPLEEDGARVGDRYRVLVETSFGRHLRPRARPQGPPSLLLVGDVDYDAAVSRKSDPDVESARTLARGGTVEWQRLFGTIGEIEAIGHLFEERFALEPARLTRAVATETAVRHAVQGRRFVHLATHGWFLPDRIPSHLDAAVLPAPAAAPCESAAEPTSTRVDSIETTASAVIQRFAPKALCGLCFAGANETGENGAARHGYLTALELAGLDLSHCELAVLSACETNVGVRRAGQGVHSLQSALQSAGARSTITSLWQVDDALTRRLMQTFYTRLWSEGEGKSEALWAAKRELRDAGYPVASWAGWVLTGDPE